MSLAPPVSRRSPREAGFTLIELLVSLMILAAAATMLLAGLGSAGLMTRRTSRQGAAAAEVSAAQMILRDRIERLRPISRADRATPLLDLAGDDRSLDFAAPPPPGAGPGPLQRYRLLRTAPGDLVLYRLATLDDRIDPRDAAIIGWTPAVLISGVRSLSIAYFGAIAPDPVPRWQGFWRDQPRAPALIRIRIGFGADDRRIWPDLAVHPAATIDLACDPEAATTCRHRA